MQLCIKIRFLCHLWECRSLFEKVQCLFNFEYNIMSETLFTKIIKREIPADIVYEDDEIIAFNDINPQAKVHILIVPKKLIPTINDIEQMDAELIGKMVIVAKELAHKNRIAENGYRLVFNCNEQAGQTVFHIHLHLLGGRVMRWPPG